MCADTKTLRVDRAERPGGSQGISGESAAALIGQRAEGVKKERESAGLLRKSKENTPERGAKPLGYC